MSKISLDKALGKTKGTELLSDIFQFSQQLEQFAHSQKDSNDQYAVTIGMERATYPNSFSELPAVQVIYNHPQTPYFLQDFDILKLTSTTPHLGVTEPSVIKGFALATFSLQKVKDLFQKVSRLQGHIYNDPDLEEISWKEKLFLQGDTLHFKGYGEYQFKAKPNGNNRKTLLEILLNSDPNGVTGRTIIKEFAKRGKTIDLPDIDAMMDQINKIFSKKFPAAKISLLNVGENNTKKVKLTVKIPKP